MVLGFTNNHPSKKSFFGALLLLTLVVPAQAQTETLVSDESTTVPAQTSVPTQTVVPAPSAVLSPISTPNSSKSVGEGYFGLGLSQISVAPRFGQSGSADTVAMFSIRYWLTDQFILEALVGGTAGTQVGFDKSDNIINDPYWAYSWGLGVKTNIMGPFDGLMVQTITRLLYLQNSSQSSNNIYVWDDQYQYLSVQAGLGFEYFMPFVKNLSVETSVNLEFDDNWESSSSSPRNTAVAPTVQSTSTWIFKITSPGFNLTSVSIHYYF